MAVTVRQKHKGKGNPWHVFIHKGNLIRSKLIGGRREAEAVAVQLRKKMLIGDLSLNGDGGAVANQSPEFSAYAEQYFESHAKTMLKRNTWLGYRVIIDRHLNPTFRGKRLDEIRRRDVKNLLLQKQRDGLAAGTVENIKALISGIFTYAYEDEILAAHPALKLGKFIQKSESRKSLSFATPEQVSKILAVTQEHHPDRYALILCAFRTGMRMGELLGLAWEDVEFDASTINVRRAYSHGHFGTPKSRKSRQIDMSNQLKLALQNHRERLRKQFGGTLPAFDVPAKGKAIEAVHLVFCSETGGPLDGDNLRHRIFYDIIEKADIPKMRFHDIRHTFASLMLQTKAPVHYVKEQMGHASITTTVDTYGHVMPNANRNAVNELDELGSVESKPLAIAC